MFLPVVVFHGVGASILHLTRFFCRSIVRFRAILCFLFSHNCNLHISKCVVRCFDASLERLVNLHFFSTSSARKGAFERLLGVLPVTIGFLVLIIIIADYSLLDFWKTYILFYLI